MLNQFSEKFSALFPDGETNRSLTDLTTIGIGGQADFYLKAKSAAEMIEAIKLCHAHDVPYRVLGWGSNVVISDNGFRGLIIHNRIDCWQVLHETPQSRVEPAVQKRFETVSNAYYSTDNLSYSDELAEKVLVRVGSGVRIIPFMKKMFEEGLTGLQWFAGIPATVGGAIFMNMHGGEHFFGSLVYRCRLFDGRVDRWVDRAYFEFDYDWSCLHETREIILEADLQLARGYVDAAKKLSIDWARRKSLQPQKSAGCVFQNLSKEQQARLGFPTPSIGYLIDEKLGLKGYAIGGAQISQQHAAFIVNSNNATAQDVFDLVQLITEKVKAQFDVELRLEIEFIGDFS